MRLSHTGIEMSNALSSFVAGMEEKGGYSLRKRDNPLEKIQELIPHLKRLMEDQNACGTIPPDKLKTMADMMLVDVTVNEKGQRICETFQEIEALTKGRMDFSTRDDEGHKRHYLAEQVSATQSEEPTMDGDIQVAKTGGKPRPKSLYM